MKKELPQMLYLSEEDVKSVVMSSGVTLKDFVKIIEEEFKAINAGDFQILPHGIVIDMTPGLKENLIDASPSASSVCVPMMAYFGPAKMAAIKWVTISTEHSKQGLPREGHLVVLTDAALCAPVSVLHGLWLTGIRTACVSAIGAKYCARTDIENVVCLIGAGFHGGFQLLLLNEVLEIKEVRIYDIIKEARERTAEGIAKKIGKPVVPVDSPDKAVRDADVVIGASTTKEPVVKHKWVDEASFLCTFAHHQHFEDRIVKSMDKIIVDYRKNYENYKRQDIGSLIGRGIMSIDDIYADLGELVTSKKKGRESDEEKILMNHGGIATHDIAVGSVVYKIAKEKGIGTWCKSQIAPFSWE